MFDLAELYVSWTENPDAFWADAESNSEQLQQSLTTDAELLLKEEVWDDLVVSACPPPDASYNNEALDWATVIVHLMRQWSLIADNAPRTGQRMEEAREALEKLLFLTRMHLARLDSQVKSSAQESSRSMDNAISQQINELLGAVSRTLQGGIAAAFPASASTRRSTLAMLYLDPSCGFLQYSSVMKTPSVVREIVRVVSLGVKLQQQDVVARRKLFQLLVYFDHSVPAIVEILRTLSNEFDNRSLAEGVLHDIAIEASGWTDTQNSANVSRAKSLNTFLSSMGHHLPSIVTSNLDSISMLIGSPVPQLRQAVLDMAPPILRAILHSEGDFEGLDGVQSAQSFAASTTTPAAMAAGQRETAGMLASDAGSASSNGRENAEGEVIDESHPDQRLAPLQPAFNLVRLLELRVNDQNHFCRVRAVQVLTGLVKEPAFIARRPIFSEVAVIKMKDRTHLVRRQAMRLMKELISSHPKVMHENDLSRKTWEATHAQITAQLEQTEPGDIRGQLEAAHSFATYTLAFLDEIDKSMVLAQTLLQSKSRLDVLDAIELLVYGDAYSVESSKAGIRKVVHLVWAKVDNDENNTVINAVVSTYRDLFMTAPPHLDSRQAAQLIADNLIAFTLESSHSELTSLERLITLAVEQEFVAPSVMSRLWGLYQTPLEIAPECRRGAAILVSMLTLADKSIARSGFSTVIEVGFGERGKKDLELAAYSCTILKRAMDSTGETQRLPPTYEAFSKIVDFLVVPVPAEKSMHWTKMAKEAVAAILNLSDSPAKNYTALIVEYHARIFGHKAELLNDTKRSQLFSQLIYLVGEVALNLSVYLDRSEVEFKRRSDAAKQAQSETATEAEQEEIMMAGGSGSNEDDFQDIIKDFREDVILYSDRAILKPFSGIVVELCKSHLLEAENEENMDSSSPSNNLLVIGATQTMAKFMCVSSKFCEANLGLMVELMGKHHNSVVRSNLVLALGDISICFNRLIDQHTEYLYDRLKDPDPIVQRTCIVALTFLILAGQIKVKGKLGELAKAMAHPNREIAKLTQMFFRELASKENAIYNGFLDMLSTLIADEALSEDNMLKSLKFLAKFITKERHIKQMTNKLVSRLPRAISERQWQAYVQVLKNMPNKLEDDVRTLIAAGYDRNPGESRDRSTISPEDNIPGSPEPNRMQPDEEFNIEPHQRQERPKAVRAAGKVDRSTNKQKPPTKTQRSKAGKQRGKKVVIDDGSGLEDESIAEYSSSSEVDDVMTISDNSSSDDQAEMVGSDNSMEVDSIEVESPPQHSASVGIINT